MPRCSLIRLSLQEVVDRQAVKIGACESVEAEAE